MELTAVGRIFQQQASFLSRNNSSNTESVKEEDEEHELLWAAIERLPTFKRVRTSLFSDDHDNGDDGRDFEGKRMVDVTKLEAVERRMFVGRLIKHIEHDNLRLLQKLKERIDRVGVKLPTVEVRYENLSVEAECEVVEGKPLLTLWNSFTSMLSVFTKLLKCKSQGTKIRILKDVNGIIKPSRFTLLLGPPGCGKTTFLLALAGKLMQSLKVTGEISYNGYKLDEFVPQKTSAYISQYDLHIPEMTVRETIDFSARCQGVGSREEIMMEVSKREKEAGIVPDPDIDTYMKAISVKGQKRTLQTDYVLKILGLDICADTMVGDAMKRGISGGQKKRLTTGIHFIDISFDPSVARVICTAGEMIVGPTHTLFMDEISTGLDSSTTFQIVSCLQHFAHITEATVLVALLQPAPETFDLFDDIILMAEGKMVYHGPCSQVLQFFEHCGFKCPERKGPADFIQEVISKKDQEQYWYRPGPYRYVSVDQLSEMFKACPLGKKLDEELAVPYDKSQSHKDAISFSKCSLRKWELLKACTARELLLMKRNSFVYVFKTTQLVVTAVITMTVFIRTQMTVDLQHSNYYLGSLFYTLIRLLTNGVAELFLTISTLPVFYKQKEGCMYPVWSYAIPTSILKIPYALVESILWTAITYYTIGYSPEAKRFFFQFLLLFALHQGSTSLCRFLASAFRSLVTASTVGSLVLLVMYTFSGFIIPRPSMPPWLRWAFWISPLTYGEIGISINEFLAPRWQKVYAGNTTLGRRVLEIHGLAFPSHFYWLSLAALFGFAILFNIGFVLALTYLKAPGPSRAMISKMKLSQLQGTEDRRSNSCHDNDSTISAPHKHIGGTEKTEKMVLPFQPLTVSFKDVQYFVDTPPEMREQGVTEKKLQLLHDITGTFRPGVLTALMGVSGAGKTTLMDVLSGRKTTGIIEGDIRIGGYPKVQKTFSRISGYCEQYDIHSPNTTVEESLTYSAWLRIPPEVDSETKHRFVEEVIETIELNDIKDSLVGIPGQSGLSTEQRKRLTIAVELVSNPSIIFMDEPTSGLDARAAAIVMRAVKNVVATGRTTVCTIHQPSIDIFEAFDELILMKRGGQIIYTGPLGHHSSELISYFEATPGLPRIKDNYNPATWMLEVTSTSVEAELGIDFSRIYKESSLYQITLQSVSRLSEPPPYSTDLAFPNRFPQNSREQFMACLWKLNLSYWRSPEYNFVRFMFMILAAFIFGATFWQKGQDINNAQDLMNILGSMYLAVIFLGINNCSAVLPYVATERTVLYREMFAGMYSSRAYSFAQVIIEVPYILLQAILYVAITYPMIGYSWSVYKVFWYFYTSFCTFLYFVYLGMLIVSVSSNSQVASILATASYTLLNLFAGFLLPAPKIPKWWIWCYWISPTSWSLNGLLTSQYGDMKKEILMYGELKSVGSFLQDYFGFRHDRLGLVAVALLAFPVVYASLFAYCIHKLNFQRR